MTNIIVVLPKLEEAKGVKNILVRSGFQVTGICTTGTQAISQADGLNDGIVICSYKLADMIYTELHEDLPEGFEMLLMASQNLISECYGNGIVCLSMPVKGTGPDQYREPDGGRCGTPQKKTPYAAESTECSG